MAEFTFCPACNARHRTGGLPPGFILRCKHCNAAITVGIEEENAEAASAIRKPNTTQKKSAQASSHGAPASAVGRVELAVQVIDAEPEPDPAPDAEIAPVSDTTPAGDGESASGGTLTILTSVNPDKPKYTQREEIGSGGMGSILRAVDHDLHREVAMKVMRQPDDLAGRYRFIEEGQVTGQLEHPNIVPVHDLGVNEDGGVFFTMKLVRGRSLLEALDLLRTGVRRYEKNYSLPRLLRIFTRICDGMAFAHSKGVVHRDLKPANIMLGDFGEVLVMDWGLAKLGVVQPTRGAQSRSRRSRGWGDSNRFKRTGLQRAKAEGTTPVSGIRSSRDTTHETLDGQIVGTPSYMSPEQAEGSSDELDQRSDVYSLGAILYELLTLKPPVLGETPQDTLKHVIAGKIVPPGTRSPERHIPQEISAITLKALSLWQQDRYQTVEELREDIDLFLEGKSVSAKEDKPWEVAVKLLRRNRGISIVTGVSVALTILLTGSAFYANVQARVVAESSKSSAEIAQHRAEALLSRFTEERAVREEISRAAAPEFLAQARTLLLQQDFTGGMKRARSAILLDGKLAAARLLLGQILIHQKEYAAAATELKGYLALRPADKDAGILKSLCQKAIQNHTPDVQLEFSRVFNRQGVYVLADLQDDAKRALYQATRERLRKTWPKNPSRLGQNNKSEWTYRITPNSNASGDLQPLAGLPINHLFLREVKVVDLAPLKEMPLQSLDLSRTRVRDITPLRSMPLVDLNLGETKISDLSPLQDSPIKTLRLYQTPITTLAKIERLSLQSLDISHTAIRDLSPLKNMPLRELGLSSCRQITNFSILKKLPLENLRLVGNRLSDWSFLSELKLRHLNVSYSSFVDIRLLHRLPLAWLSLRGLPNLTHLGGIEGLAIAHLELSGSGISDFSALAKLPLTHLSAEDTRLQDLTVLNRKKLTYLNLNNSRVISLAPLKGMPLENLYIGKTKVVDLTPLANLPLRNLNLAETPVHDLSPLKGLALKTISFTPKNIQKGIDILREMPTLTSLRPTISGRFIHAEEFWQRYDAGNFR